MVRLNFAASIATITNAAQFQFQNGTIKFKNGINVMIVDTSFQFQNGTIKLNWHPSIKLVENKVSIPKWYD
mgnify:CR=1 FL=1